MAKVSLDFIVRCFYIVYYIKFALAFFYPEVAQQYTDFCASCNFGSDDGKVAAARECWSYFFIALLWTAVVQMDKDKCQRKVIQYGITLPATKLFVTVYFGASVMGTESNQFISAVIENVILFLGMTFTCYVWFPAGKPKREKTSLLEFTAYTNAVRIQYIEQFVLFCFSAYSIYEGDGGVFALASTAATQLGLAVLLAGVSQCANEDQDKVVKYYMVKKCIDLYYLNALAIPFVLSSSTSLLGTSGLIVAYLTTAWYVCTLVQMMMCCYYATPNRASFWMASLAFGFLGTLGMFFPSSTATAFYRIPELSGANDIVFKLIGLFSILISAVFMGFANEFNMNQFEKMFVYAYGLLILCCYCLYTNLYLGVFSDILNVFLLWCIWMTWGENGPSSISFSRFVPKFLKKGVKKVTSPLSSPKKSSMMKSSRGRSKTPGRKSQ